MPSTSYGQSLGNTVHSACDKSKTTREPLHAAALHFYFDTPLSDPIESMVYQLCVCKIVETKGFTAKLVRINDLQKRICSLFVLYILDADFREKLHENTK